MKINLSGSLLILTGMYLFYNICPFYPGDPFLLYIGLVFLLYYNNSYNIIFLATGLPITFTGIGQLIIISNMNLNLNYTLLITALLGLALIIVFILEVIYKKNNLNLYWPLVTGFILIIVSLIYHYNLELQTWQTIKTYWPLSFFLIAVADLWPFIINTNINNYIKKKNNNDG